MFKNKKFKVISLVALLLIVSTVAQASGFNYNKNTYKNKRDYSLNHKFYDEGTNRDYDYKWEVSITPGKWTASNGSSRPDFNQPNYPEKPNRPSQPENPALPNGSDKPNLPEQENKPNRPENKPAEPNKPSQPNNSGSLSQIELEVVRLVNEERQKQGLSQFRTSGDLSNVARTKSQDMSINNYFSHQSPKYGSPFDMLGTFGIKYTSAGENIAKGYYSAQAVVNGWMNSSGHRANILNPSFNTIGVGAYEDSTGTIYWTQLFTN